jgi:hypothetical protein
MVNGKPSQAAIARDLGISPGMVSRLKRQGMPVHALEAARAWRAANLDLSRMRPDPSVQAANASELLLLAREALRVGRFELVAPDLRAAMRAVPLTHRHTLSMGFDLWEALVGPDALKTIRKLTDPTATGEESDDGADVGDAPAEEFVYALACGEVRFITPVQ